MTQEILRQANFNSGELSPQATARRDLKAYASSLAMCENMVPMAEGPVRRRPGTEHIGFVRNKLQLVPITEAMLSVPNGGTAASLVAGVGFETTAPMGTESGYVMLEIDFGNPTEVAMFDIVDFVVKSPSSGGGGGTLDPLPDPTPPQYPWGPTQLQMEER